MDECRDVDALLWVEKIHRHGPGHDGRLLPGRSGENEMGEAQSWTPPKTASDYQERGRKNGS